MNNKTCSTLWIATVIAISGYSYISPPMDSTLLILEKPNYNYSKISGLVTLVGAILIVGFGKKK